MRWRVYLQREDARRTPWPAHQPVLPRGCQGQPVRALCAAGQDPERESFRATQGSVGTQSAWLCFTRPDSAACPCMHVFVTHVLVTCLPWIHTPDFLRNSALTAAQVPFLEACPRQQCCSRWSPALGFSFGQALDGWQPLLACLHNLMQATLS